MKLCKDSEASNVLSKALESQAHTLLWQSFRVGAGSQEPGLAGPDEDLRLQGRHCLICNFNPDFAVAWYSQAKPFKFE
jgi:hypothetical protein